MDGAGMNGRKLRSIIALLVQLASVADLAAGRAFPIRWMVLFFLRRGERAAQVYVARALHAELADLEDELAPVSGPADASPADAVLIAWRFRWYATVLGALLDLLGGDARTTGRDRVPDRRACRAGRPAVLPGLPLPRLHDTS